MKNVLFKIKSVITGSSKAVAGAGAEKNSFGSATLVPRAEDMETAEMLGVRFT
jgi:hypothetical protein